MLTRDALEEILEYGDSENEWMFMPNEMFVDFPQAFSDSSSKLAFAYSYYYLISYLYWFTKYDQGKTFDVDTMYQILGYARGYSGMSSVIKKGGKLDDLGYTHTSTDVPIDRCWGDPGGHYDPKVHSSPRIFTWNDFSEDMKSYLHSQGQRPISIKIPVKGLYRDINPYVINQDQEANATQIDEPDDELEQDGTFFVHHKTTQVPIEVFLYCMSDDELGTSAFYLYSWMKCKYELFQAMEGEFYASQDQISNWSGVGKSSLKKYLKVLEQCHMIEVKRARRTGAVSADKRDANVYIVRPWHEFLSRRGV